MDQATTLRQIVGQSRPAAPALSPRASRVRVIAVTSGKGGVGKTNIVVNLCIALARMRRRVFLLDADMGLANVDVLLGMTPRYTIEHVLSGRKELLDIVMEGPGGFKVLPASSGISELSELTYEQQMQLFRALGSLDAEMDYLFIDTGAGISSNVLRFNASANEIVLVANAEPTSITDAYALMKLLSIKYHLRAFSLIANSVASEDEGQAVYERLHKVAAQFLNVTLDYLGPVPYDKAVSRAVRQQRPLLELYPTAPASRGLMRIAALLDQPAARLSALAPPSAPGGPLTSTAASTGASIGASAGPQTAAAADATFWDRLLHWKKVK
jgi:flagellar biosynthesis protein FlhG